MDGVGIVAHNIAATFTYNRLNGNARQKANSLEKLSSGFRINRAADDAAGLTISESMRSRIRGLKQGNNNISDGIALIQTADGALDEITSMLQRMNKLSVQARNGTYTKENREQMQAEVDELKSEIDRIVDSTEFNGIKLLKGSSETVESPYTKSLPSWINIKGGNGSSNSMGLNGQYDQTQDTSKYFEKKLEGKNETVYYGPAEDTVKYASTGSMKYTYGGAWTPSLEDNMSATISFQGLVDRYAKPSEEDMAKEDYVEKRTAANLYQDIYSLLGSSVGMSCSTCMDDDVVWPIFYGVSFVGTAVNPDTGLEETFSTNRMQYTDASADSSATQNAVDLGSLIMGNGQSVFEYLYGLDASESEPDQIGAIASDIAKRLFDATYNSLNKF